MALTLQYTHSATVPIEVEGLTPQALKSKSISEIERMEVYEGNVKVPAAEMFKIQGDASDGRLVFQGDLSGVHWIGASMGEGSVRVEGHAGRHVGSEMTGGEILVEGDAGDWVGGEMHGGQIHVRGRAGHLIGAAYRGSRRGMTQGTILIGGDVGNEVGHTMRRGLIVVGGAIGDTAGFNMIAGTVMAFGDSGIRQGAGMRRGTIGLLGENSVEMLPTFRRACRYRPSILALIFSLLRQADFPVPDRLAEAQFDAYSGDLIEGGRGEILVIAT